MPEKSDAGQRNGSFWKSMALILAGAITGGGGSAAVGHSQYSELRAELKVQYSDLNQNLEEMTKEMRESNRLNDERHAKFETRIRLIERELEMDNPRSRGNQDK